MNVLPDVYICPLRKKSAPLLPEGTVTVKNTHLTEINKMALLAKISMESDTVKHLKAFKIISSEMPISLLILS